MNETKQEKKVRKKAYRKARRKATRPWKGLTFFSGIISIVLIPILVFLSMFDNTVAAFVGGSFWKLKNEDKNAVYYESDFETTEEMNQYGLELCETVEEEGAALLMNENNALPLEKGAKVSCFSNSSVNLVYGGTGSGNIDASSADTLKTALEKSGFEVNKKLWNFYSKGEGSKYARKTAGMVAEEGEKTTEVPWNVYTDDVKDSVASYGDAAIVVLSRIGGEGADLDFKETNYLALDDNEKEMLQNVAEMKKAGQVKKIVVLINSANTLQVDFLKNNEYDVDACMWIGDVGISGINAVAEILAGNVTPSGSLVDTYLYDNFSAPAMMNFVPTVYEGYEEGIIPEEAKDGTKIMSVNLLLPNESDPVIWRGPVIANVVTQFWTDVMWGELDYLFVDMPPGTGDVPLTVFQSLPVDGIVIVTSPQDLVQMIVKKAYNMACQMDIPVLGIVENYSYLVCPDCGKKISVFGESHVDETAKELDIPVIGKMPIDAGLAEAVEEERFYEISNDYLTDAVNKL